MAFIPPSAFNLSGTYASRPTAGLAGRIYQCTDGPVSFRDNGSAWVPYGPVFQLTTPPGLATFTAYNAGGRSTTWTDSSGGLTGSLTNGTNAEDIRSLIKSLPAAPYTITIHMLPLLAPAQYPAAGLIWRSTSVSTPGYVESFGVYGNVLSSSLNIQHRKCTANNATTSPTYTLGTTGDALAECVATGAGVWLQIADDNTNRYMRFSTDGVNFRAYTAVTRTTFMTPDQYGVYIANGPGSNTLAACTFTSLVVA